MPRLASFKLRLAEGHARLVFADGRATDLFGHKLERFVETCRPLVRAVERRCDGDLRAVSVDFRRKVLRATYDASPQASPKVGVVSIVGDEFEADVLPIAVREHD